MANVRPQRGRGQATPASANEFATLTKLLCCPQISPLVGKFFGEVDAAVFNQLIKYNIYKKVTIYDYQAVCFSIKAGQGSASILRNPFAALLRAVLFLLNGIVTNLGKLTVIDTQWWFYNPMRVFGYGEGPL